MPFNKTLNSTYIPLSVPYQTEDAAPNVNECLKSGWVSSAGPFVEKFEKEFASYVKAPQGVACASGTAALHLALLSVGLKPDELVLVSNLTFVAPVNAIRYCEAFPVFIDASAETWQMNPAVLLNFLEDECRVKEGMCIHKKTKKIVRAVLPVHIMGLACEMEKILEIARKFQLAVVEDAAEGVGVTYKGQHVGTFGSAGAFSFNGNKIITAGGGGVMISNDPKKTEYAKYLSTQAKDDAVENIHNEIGFNYRLTNLQAAVALSQLGKVDQFKLKKKKIYENYETAFSSIDELEGMPVLPDVDPTYWLSTFLMPPSISFDQRKKIIADLEAEKIQARPFWHPIHGLPPYRTTLQTHNQVSIDLYRRGISFPSSVGLTEENQSRVVEVFKKIIKRVL